MRHLVVSSILVALAACSDPIPTAPAAVATAQYQVFIRETQQQETWVANCEGHLILITSVLHYRVAHTNKEDGPWNYVVHGDEVGEGTDTETGARYKLNTTFTAHFLYPDGWNYEPDSYSFTQQYRSKLIGQGDASDVVLTMNILLIRRADGTVTAERDVRSYYCLGPGTP